jgi:hypothetical protein
MLKIGFRFSAVEQLLKATVFSMENGKRKPWKYQNEKKRHDRRKYMTFKSNEKLSHNHSGFCALTKPEDGL